MNFFYEALTYLAFLLLALCICTWIAKSPLRAFIKQMTEFWNKAGWLLRVGALTGFLALWIYASVKPPMQAPTPLSQQVTLIMGGASSALNGIEIIPPDAVTS